MADVLAFEMFAKKAAERIEAKKKRSEKTVHVGALDEDIVIRALTDQEFIDCSEYSESSVEVDKYTVYYASRTLQELAGYMVEQGMIRNHLEVMDMFSAVDRTALARQVMALSGYAGESTVSELDEVKK